MISFQKNIKTHGPEEVEWIKQSMADIGIDEFRFCSENDCYVCDRNGNFYSVCTRQMSKAGNLIEKYRVVPLKGSVDKYGYLTYRVTVGGIKKHLKAHRMMMNAWVTDRILLLIILMGINRTMPCQILNGALSLKIMRMRSELGYLIRI